MQKRVWMQPFAWVRTPGARGLASLDTKRPGRRHWVVGHVISDPGIIELAERVGRGLATGGKVPDLTGELGPHPLLESFRNAPGLARVSIGPRAKWRWSENGCLRSVPIRVTRAYRGPLKEGESATLELPPEDQPAMQTPIIAYERGPHGPVMIGRWAATLDARVLATMVTGAPTPKQTWPRGAPDAWACRRGSTQRCPPRWRESTTSGVPSR